MNAHLLVLTGVLFLVPTPGDAENHFVAEVAGGMTTIPGIDAPVDAGSTLTGTLGIGGRFRGFKPAFYAVVRWGRSGLSAQGPDHFGRPSAQAEYNHWGIGARVYVPIVSRLRLLGQFTIGQNRVRVSVNQDQSILMEDVAEHFAVFPLAGIQFRISDHLSFGVVGEWSLYPDSDPNQFLAASIGTTATEEASTFSSLATFTVHF